MTTTTPVAPASSRCSDERHPRPVSRHVSLAAYGKLSPSAKRVLAAVERLNDTDELVWWCGPAHLADLARLDLDDALQAVHELREAKIIDFIVHVDDARASLVVSAWRNRRRLMADLSQRIERAARASLRRTA